MNGSLLFEVSHGHEHAAGRRFAALRRLYYDTIHAALLLASSSSSYVLAHQSRICRYGSIPPLAAIISTPTSSPISSSSSLLSAVHVNVWWRTMDTSHIADRAHHAHHAHDHVNGCDRGTLVDLIVSYVPLMMGA